MNEQGDLKEYNLGIRALKLFEKSKIEDFIINLVKNEGNYEILDFDLNKD